MSSHVRPEIEPTIKGLFINSHLRVLKGERGPDGLEELWQRLGRSFDIKNSDDIPVTLESAMLEHCVEIQKRISFPKEVRAYEAGKLHFKNFLTTGMGKILKPIIRHNFKKIIIHSDSVARRVFKGVEFEPKEINSTEVILTIKNDQYPIEHFQGFFKEWMDFSIGGGTVEAKELEPHIHTFHLTWAK